MRCGLHIVLAGALLFGSSVVALGDNVRTDYNHQTDFSQYHTYSWGKVTTKIPFYADRIKQEVNLQFQARPPPPLRRHPGHSRISIRPTTLPPQRRTLQGSSS